MSFYIDDVKVIQLKLPEAIDTTSDRLEVAGPQQSNLVVVDLLSALTLLNTSALLLLRLYSECASRGRTDLTDQISEQLSSSKLEWTGHLTIGALLDEANAARLNEAADKLQELVDNVVDGFEHR